MATARDFVTAETYLGRVSSDTIKMFPALSFLTSQKGAGEAGMDAEDPISLRGIASSNASVRKIKTLATAGDQRTIERITGIKDIGLAPLQGSSIEELETSGFAGKETALNIQTRGRQAAFRQVLDAQNRLDEMAGLEADIRRKGNKLRLQATEPLDKQIAETQNQMFVARSMLMDKLANQGLSPSHQNAILSAQRGFFQNRIDNIEDIRKSLLSAIDDKQEELEAFNTRQTEMSKNRITGLERSIKFIEDTAGDFDAAAELRLKLAQERKKGAKKDTMPSSQEVIFQQIVRQMEDNRLANELDPNLSPGDIDRAKKESKRVDEARKGSKMRMIPGTKGLSPDLLEMPRIPPVKISIDMDLAQAVWDEEITPAEAGGMTKAKAGIMLGK